MNVLAIGWHPDDIEINCSGTLAKCVNRGDKVTVCHQKKERRDMLADMVKTISKYCGYRCSATYAEAFSRCMVYAKPTIRRMLP